MTKSEQLLQLLRAPHTITHQGVCDLQALLKNHPYFQVGYALLAKAAQVQNPATAKPAIQMAAIYATDRSCLQALLEKQPGPTAPKPSEPPAYAAKQAVEKRADFVNDYIDTLQQRYEQPITSQRSLAQQQLIQRFIRKGTPFKPQAQPISSEAHTETDFTQESTTLHEGLATEGLAKIFVQQGKIQRAKTIYNQLALKFPEKKAYFADLIQALNSSS